MTTTIRRVALSFLLFVLAAVPARGADRVSLAVPGVPPVFSGLVAYVAKEQGLFQKQGVDVDVRPFDSGAAAAQAVVTGNIDLSLSPTPVIVRMVSNAGVDLVGIYGIDAARHPPADNDQRADADPPPRAEAAGRQHPPEAVLAAPQQFFEIGRLRPAPAWARSSAIAAAAVAPRSTAARAGAPRATALT